MTAEMTLKLGTDDGRLKIAIQKSGRLSEKSFTILEKAGISLQKSKDQLLCQARNFPLDIFLVRDDDIPAFLVNNVCQLGIIGQNSLLEAQSLEVEVFGGLEQVINLGFGRCRLSLATPNGMPYDDVSSLVSQKEESILYPRRINILDLKYNFHELPTFFANQRTKMKKMLLCYYQCLSNFQF